MAFYMMASPGNKDHHGFERKISRRDAIRRRDGFGMRIFLNKYGLEPVKDVPLVQIGGMPELTTALSKKAV